jgi:transglutaminase-like putative cysteine protease
MQYDAYENKIKKIVAVLRKTVRLLPIIIPAICVVLAGITALLITKGNVGDITAPEQITYGESITCKANAFLSSVGFEHKSATGGEWSKDLPTFPGTYQIRAVAKGSFGKLKYSDERTIAILPKAIDVSLARSTVVYGNMPELKAALAYSDKLVCGSFKYGDILAKTTTVTPDISAIKIVNNVGLDVTAAYTLNVQEGTVTFAKRSIGVTVDDASTVYDGKSFSYTVAEVNNGTLAEGDQLSAVFSKNLTDVGEISNEPSTLSIATADGKDVTHHYDIKVTAGTLTVEKRPLVIHVDNKTVTYDGTVHSCEYRLGNELPIVEGHIPTVKLLEATDSGEYANTAVVKITDRSGRDVTDNYFLTVEKATLTINKRDIHVIATDKTVTYDGKAHSCDYRIDTKTTPAYGQTVVVDAYEFTDHGVYNDAMTVWIKGKYGTDVTYNYNVDFTAPTLTINKRYINVISADKTVTYDGAEHWCDYRLDASTPVADGQSFFVDQKHYINHGVYTDTPNVIITDMNGVPTTHNYDINIGPSTLTINKRNITVYTSSQTWEYDSYLHCGEVTNVTNLPSGQTYRINDGEQTFIRYCGTATNNITISVLNGRENTTDNYIIDYRPGTLTVTKRYVTIITNDYCDYYNGQEQSCPYYTVISANDFAPLDTFEVISSTASTDITYGKVVNAFYNYNVRGFDVDSALDSYVITIRKGSFEIMPRPITVAPEYTYAIYDAKPHSPERIEVVDGLGLVDGHTITGTMIGSRVNVGTTVTSIIPDSIVIKNGDAVVTYNYTVSTVTGKIYIDPRPLTVTTGSDVKIYDATPLICHKLIPTPSDGDNGLVDGHSIIAYTITGTRTEFGISDNTMIRDSIVISDGNENVTPNYDIEIILGTLEIKKRPIKIESASASKMYDGTPLTASSWDYADDSEYRVVDGQTLEIFVIGERTKVGTGPNTIARDDTVVWAGTISVTDNYEIEYVEGTLEIKPWAVITVTTYSDSKLYDGTPLTNGNYEIKITDGELFSGHKVTVTVFGSQTEPGVSPNRMSVSVTDEYGNDASIYYRVTRNAGILEVLDKPISEIVVGKILTDKGGRVYLRQDSYGAYNGTDTNWGMAPAYGEQLPGGYNGNYVTSFILRNIGATKGTAKLEGVIDGCYMLPYYAIDGGSYEIPSVDTVYTDISMSDYEVPYYMLPTDALMDVYSLRGNLGKYEEYERKYSEFVHNNYLDVPDATREYMLGVIADNGFNVNNSSVVFDVAHFVQHAISYNLKYDSALDLSEDVAVDCLEIYKEGVCRHYATVATMIYRTLGIPARYVTGFMVETVAGEWKDVTTPGHAWVEVYIDGVGWIQVEVTGGPTINDDEENMTIEIVPSYQFKVDDGTPLYATNDIDMTENLEKLIKMGYSYEVVVVGKQEGVGRGTSSISKFVLYDPDGVDVTKDFSIIYTEGVLEILPAEKKVITVVINQLHQIYNGNPLMIEDGDWEILDGADGLTLDITFNVSLTNVGSITIGQLNWKMDEYVSYTVYDKNGKDVTDMYRIVLEAVDPLGNDYVPISVEKSVIEITAASNSKVHDGEPLSDPTFTLTKGKLAKGHYIEARAFGSITEIGSRKNIIDPQYVRIYDADGHDVTANYEITTVEGVLEIIASDNEN